MHERELNRATIEVVSNLAISGRAAADGIKRGSQTEEKGCFSRIASSAILGYLMAVGFLVALLAPLPARAEDDKDPGNGHGDNDKGIRAEIAALKAQVAALQGQVNTLKTQLAGVQSNHALLLGPFVNVDPNPEIGVIGPNIIFSGANIHIVSGSGSTNDNGNPTGLGNLIIGYDEDPGNLAEVPGFGNPPNAPPLNPGDRGGSHNLVVGAGNRFTKNAFGGLVAGYLNTISDYATCVSGGSSNTASGFVSNVSGGQFNQASGRLCSVSGGYGNVATILVSSVSGGLFNTASNFFASVLGGQFNTASGQVATVVGGSSNTANQFESVVLGGQNNTAGGGESVVLGGQGVTDNNNNSIAPQPPFP